MKPFANNQDLYAYLLTLSARLVDQGLDDLGNDLILASRHASGMSTEFLGESRLALRRVLNIGRDTIGEENRAEIEEALAQLDAVFDRR